MATSPHTLLQVATGGKENELKVWDGNKLDSPLFQGKNVSASRVGIRTYFCCFSTFCKCICLYPDGGGELV